MSPQKPAQRSQGTEPLETTRKPSQKRTAPSRGKPDGKSEPLVRSVLIEPRETEPPRVSVSVEYESEAPSLKALQKAAMETIHEVVSQKPMLVDLGFRHQQRSRELVQVFEVREKESN